MIRKTHAEASAQPGKTTHVTPQRSFGLREATIRTRPKSEIRTSLNQY